MPRQHRVTIREIARMCGVSMQTVSRVINNRPDVSPATRRAVEAAIAVRRVPAQRGRAEPGPATVADPRGDRDRAEPRSASRRHSTGSPRRASVPTTRCSSRSSPPTTSRVSRQPSTSWWPPGRRADHLQPAERGNQRIRAPGGGTRGAAADRRAQVRAVDVFSTISVDNCRRRTDGDRAPPRPRPRRGSGTSPGRRAGERRAIAPTAGEPRWPTRASNPDRSLPAIGRRQAARRRFASCSATHRDLDAVFVANDQMALGLLHVAHERGIDIPGTDRRGRLRRARRGCPVHAIAHDDRPAAPRARQAGGPGAALEAIDDGARTGGGPEPDAGDGADRARQRADGRSRLAGRAGRRWHTSRCYDRRPNDDRRPDRP